MTDVFISYSRQDTAFARRLFDGLKSQNRTPWIDWEGIPYSVDWWKEICRGIDAADTFILIISPASMTSMICSQEIEYARRSNKRIVPVIYRQPDEKQLAGEWFGKNWEPVARDNWMAIKQINWLFFRDEDDFDTSFADLIKTVEENPDHVRVHTRLLVRAREWENSQHNPSFLLRGDDLRKAEAWLGQALERPPAPVSLHIEYITASRRAERARQRSLLTGVSFALILALILTVLSLFLFQDANTQRQRADDNVATSQANFFAAATAEVAAKKQEDRARSEALAAYSQTIEDTDPELALKLALDANRIVNASPNAWRQLSRLAFAVPVRRQMQVNNMVSALAFSPDDRRLAIVDRSSEVTIWDTATGQQVARFSGGEMGICAAFSPDGRWLAAGFSVYSANVQLITEDSYDPAKFIIVVADAETGDIVYRLTGHSGSVNTVDFSPDGRWLISGSGHRTIDNNIQTLTDPARDRDRNEILLWDMTTGDLVERFEGHSGTVMRVRFLPDGGHFLSVGNDGQLLEWDINSGEATRLGQFGVLTDMALSSDGNQILLTGSGMRLVDRRAQVLQTFDSYGEAVALSPDGNTAFVSKILGANLVLAFDVRSGQEVGHFTEHNAMVGALALSHDGRWLASGGADNLVILRNVAADERQILVGQHDKGIWDIAFTPDGHYLLSVSHDGQVKMWDVEQRALLHQFEGHTNVVRQITVSPDGAWAASADDDNRIAVWDIDPASATFGDALYWLNGAANRGLTFVQDRAQIAGVSSDNNRSWLTLWDVSTDEQITRLDLNAAWTYDVVYGTNWLAVLTSKEVKLFTFDPAAPADLTSVRTFPLLLGGFGINTGQLNILYDGQQLAVAEGSFTAMSNADRARVQLINLDTGQVRSFVGAQTTVWSVAISPDAAMIAAGYSEGTAIIWDASTGAEVQRVEGLPSQVKSVAFSPQGNMLALATDDIGETGGLFNQVLLLKIYTPQELIEYVEQNFSLRDYSCGERLTYGVGEPCE